MDIYCRNHWMIAPQKVDLASSKVEMVALCDLFSCSRLDAPDAPENIIWVAMALQAAES